MIIAASTVAMILVVVAARARGCWSGSPVAFQESASPAAAAPVPGAPAAPAAPVVPAAATSAPRQVAPDGGVRVQGSASASPVGERQLMTRLRSIKDKDPAAAVALAREGNRRFPDSSDAPERASILIRALAALGQTSEARGEAESMVNHYPDSEWVRDMERFSGAHRRRNIRVNDAGLVEYR